MGQVLHPSPVGYKDIDLSWMVGCVMVEVLFQEPTLWSFKFGQKTGISVECLWRIVKDGRVVLTSGDHGHQFGLPAPVDAAARCTELLSKQSVAAVQLREATADLLIEFADGLRLEVIPDLVGYESWQLNDPSGMSYVAQGGGQICKWKL